MRFATPSARPGRAERTSSEREVRLGTSSDGRRRPRTTTSHISTPARPSGSSMPFAPPRRSSMTSGYRHNSFSKRQPSQLHTSGNLAQAAYRATRNELERLWDEQAGSPAHVNDEGDAVIIVAEETTQVVPDDVTHHVRPGHVVVPRGATLALTARPDGVRYISINRRRSALRIRRTDSQTDVGIATPEVASAGYPGESPAGDSIALTGNSCGSSPSAAS